MKKISLEKFIKKILFIIVAMLVVISAVAQKAGYGLKGGLNVTNLNYSGSSASPTMFYLLALFTISNHKSQLYITKKTIIIDGFFINYQQNCREQLI